MIGEDHLKHIVQEEIERLSAPGIEVEGYLTEIEGGISLALSQIDDVISRVYSIKSAQVEDEKVKLRPFPFGVLIAVTDGGPSATHGPTESHEIDMSVVEQLPANVERAKNLMERIEDYVRYVASKYQVPAQKGWEVVKRVFQSGIRIIPRVLVVRNAMANVGVGQLGEGIVALGEIVVELNGAGQKIRNWIRDPSTEAMLNDLTNSLPNVKQKLKNVLLSIKQILPNK
jgi:hypothetical protein